MRILISFLLILGITLTNCKNQPAQEPETTEETPTTTIDQWLTFEGNTAGKKVVLISGDEEYRSEEVLPQLARILSKHHGMNCTVLFAQNPEKPGIVDPNYLHNIPGLDALASADLMIIFTRFRALPDDQMQHIDNYLKSGKPVIGIRTATHAFNFKEEANQNWAHYGNFYEGEKAEWTDGFGRLILGEHWISHHGWHKHQSTKGMIAEGAATHPITAGLADGAIWGPTDVYGVRLPLPGDAQPIILGQVVNRKGEFDESDILFGMSATDDEVATENPKREESGNPNDPMMPVAWTKSYQIPGGQQGKAFASTVGSSTDFLSEGVRRMYVNAAHWCLDLPVPEKAKADLVGTYQPTAYSFKDDQYWQDKNLTLAAIKALDK